MIDLENLSLQETVNLAGNAMAVAANKAEQELAGKPYQAEMVGLIENASAVIGDMIAAMEGDGEGTPAMPSQPSTPTPDGNA